MKINKKVKTILVCEDCLSRNYRLNKGVLNQKTKLVVNKHCPHCKRHTKHYETR